MVSPPTVSTTQLRGLLESAGPLWLVFVPDGADPSAGHIPGSLVTADEALLAALPRGTPMVLYGEDAQVTRSPALVLRLAAAGRDARWYAGGLQAWAADGLPVERSPELG